jgi:hypothetical protein
MVHDDDTYSPEQAEIDAAIAALECTDPLRATILRRVATDLAALEQALAPYGLMPLHDNAPLQEGQHNERAVKPVGETGYTVTRTGAGYIVTDAAGRVVAASVDGPAGR